MTAAEVLAAETCLFEAWPPEEIAGVAGWRARASDGGYRRLDSVWPAHFDGSLAVETAVDHVEQFYGVRGLPPRFMVLRTAVPAGLDGILADRGYVAEGSTLTMAADVVGMPMPSAVTAEDTAGHAWLTLQDKALDEARKAGLPGVLKRLPRDRLFVTAWLDGVPAGTALGVFAAGAVAVECVYTAPAARGQGLARRLLAALDSWAFRLAATRMVLAVDEENVAARRLYDRARFTRISHYHYREQR